MLNKIKHIFLLLVGLALLFLILDKIYPLDTNRIFKPKSTVIYDKNNQVIRVHLSEDGFLRMPIENKNITNDIKDVLLSYEDKYFYEHFGVNPISILRALWFNLQNKRVIGASTITMQLARMSHHKPRTIKSKIYEIFMAFQLEYHYTKDEILELYLNNTPYGGNIEGFASAAYKYFGVPVESLSLAQIAYLVSIPKNPNRIIIGTIMDVGSKMSVTCTRQKIAIPAIETFIGAIPSRPNRSPIAPQDRNPTARADAIINKLFAVSARDKHPPSLNQGPIHRLWIDSIEPCEVTAIGT